MKNKVLYILVALCAGFSAQAQQVVITEYSVKLKSLSEAQVESLDHLINGGASSVFVNDEVGSSIYQHADQPVKTISLSNPKDFALLLKAYSGQLDGVQLINIEWNGTDIFTFTEDLLSKLTNLDYIYIRSYENLSKAKIEGGFQVLLKLLENQTKVEILYTTMEQAR